MKNQTNCLMTFLFASALLLASCTTTVEPDLTLAAPTVITPTQPSSTTTSGIVGIYNAYPLDPSVNSGDTIIVKQKLKLHGVPNAAVDVAALKNNTDADLKGNPIRYVAVGGSLTAGVRNFGLYQDGQQTNFAAMLARQMKIPFRQPLFADTEFNGYGYKALSTNPFGTPVPYYKVVKNNTAILNSTNYVTLNKYTGEVDNFGVPFARYSELNLNGWVNTSNRGGRSPKIFQDRFMTTGNVSADTPPTKTNALLSQRFDFFTLETSLDYYGGSFFNAGTLTAPPNYAFLKYAKKINAKGLIANIPDISDFPYFNLISLNQIKKALGKDVVYLRPSQINNSAITITDDILFLPTTAIDSILNPINKLKKQGATFDNPILTKDVISKSSVNFGINLANTDYDKWAKEFNYPVVDLYSLFKKIAAGTHTTAAGTKADPTFKTGNFFSNDGLYPTAFGQAIIANEFIKTFNGFYKTKIPLIREEDYL